jgi:tetratricopeptide (TPR) repeat protein
MSVGRSEIRRLWQAYLHTLPLQLTVLALLCAGVSSLRAQTLPRLTAARSVLLTEGNQPAQVREPTRIFLAQNGHLYLTDRRKGDVLWYDENFVWRGVLSSRISEASFDDPVRTRVDSNGRILVAEGGTGTIWVLGERDMEARFGGRGNKPGQFRRLEDFAIDADDYLYATDADGKRVQIFTPDGLLSRVLNGFGPMAFDKPSLIAVDIGGRIYVYDRGLQAVLAGDVSGGMSWQFSTRGSFRGDRDVIDIVADDYGTVYLLSKDLAKVVMLNRDGRRVGEMFGKGTGIPMGLNRPVGLAMGPGTMAVLDQRERRVQEFTVSMTGNVPQLEPVHREYLATTGETLRWQPVAVAPETEDGPERWLAFPPYSIRSPDGSGVQPVQLPGSAPEIAVATGTREGFVMVDRDRRIHRVDRGGRLLGTIPNAVGGGEIKRPAAIAHRATDGVLAVYDEDDDDVFLLDFDGRFRSRVGRRGTGPGELRDVTSLAFDAAGRLMIVDQKGGRIQLFDEFGVLTRDAPTANILSRLRGPIAGIGADAWGNIFVLDGPTGLVIRIDDEGVPVCTVGDPRRLDSAEGLTVTPDGRTLVRGSVSGGRAIPIDCLGPPPRPRDLRLTLGTGESSGVILRWADGLPGAESFEVYRRVPDGEWSSIGTSTESSFTLPENLMSASPASLAVAGVNGRGKVGRMSDAVLDRLSPSLLALEAGRAPQAEGWIAQALAEARTTENASSDMLGSLIRLQARALAAQGNYDRALELLGSEQQTLGEAGALAAQVEVYREAASGAAAAGDGTAAMAWLQRMISIPGTIPSPLEQRALDLAAAGDEEVATALLSTYGSLADLDGARLTRAVAQTRVQLGQRQQALDDLIAAYREAAGTPLQSDLIRSVSLAAEELVGTLAQDAGGSSPEIDGVFERLDACVLTLDPFLQDEWALRMDALRIRPRIEAAMAMEGSDFTRARELYEEILADSDALLVEDEVRVRAHLGALSLATGDTERAREEFGNVLNLSPDWQPSEDEFSPSVRRFIDNVRAELGFGTGGP